MTSAYDNAISFSVLPTDGKSNTRGEAKQCDDTPETTRTWKNECKKIYIYTDTDKILENVPR